jgi:hypothetical protein
MKFEIDRILVSSNYNPMFLNYWPVVAKSWLELFELNVTLVLVGPTSMDPKVVSKLKTFGDVEIVWEIPEVPSANQAKLARWFVACKQESKVVSIEDLDTIYLKNTFLVEKLAQYESGKLLGIGSEVYEFHDGLMKFPASNLTGSGFLFSELFGYREGMSFSEFVYQYQGMRVFDSLEDPFKSPKRFSDESLIRALRKQNSFGKIKVIERNIDIKTEWLDRSWWPSRDNLDVNNYTTVNFLRPLLENYKDCKAVLDLFYPNSYPWIMKTKTPIRMNRDHKIRRLPMEIKYAVKNRVRKLKIH